MTKLCAILIAKLEILCDLTSLLSRRWIKGHSDQLEVLYESENHVSVAIKPNFWSNLPMASKDALNCKIWKEHETRTVMHRLKNPIGPRFDFSRPYLFSIFHDLLMRLGLFFPEQFFTPILIPNFIFLLNFYLKQLSYFFKFRIGHLLNRLGSTILYSFEIS